MRWRQLGVCFAGLPAGAFVAVRDRAKERIVYQMWECPRD